MTRNYQATEEQEHFDAIAASYENLFSLRSDAARRKAERLCDRFAPWLDGAPAGAVVELGAGTGFFTRHLAPRMPKRDYLATDLSPGMLEIGRGTSKDVSNVSWRKEDCTRLKLADRSVACVTGHGILHHVPLRPTIVEMARVLKPGGRISFYEPNLLNPYVFLVKKVPGFRLKGDTPGETGLIAFHLRGLLRRAGFVEIAIVPCEFTLNQVPASLVPTFEKFSRLMERVPLVRGLGGSLRITAAMPKTSGYEAIKIPA